MAPQIKEIEFITSAVNAKGWPPAGPPEIAFAGRSNVGKSSLLNTLVRRRKLARVSSKPGRTQQINFFSLNQGWLNLVDLPGYGFAKVPVSVKKKWQVMIEAYLTGRETLAGVVVILDLRREPTPEDLMLLDYLRANRLAAVVVATKADKLSRNQQNQRLAKLGPLLAAYDEEPVIFSAASGLGREALWARLSALAFPAA